MFSSRDWSENNEKELLILRKFQDLFVSRIVIYTYLRWEHDSCSATTYPNLDRVFCLHSPTSRFLESEINDLVPPRLVAA